MRILGLLILAGAIGYQIVFRAGLAANLDLSSVLVVIVGTLGLMMLSGDSGSWKSLLKLVTFQSKALSPTERDSLAALLRAGSRGAIGLGVVSHLVRWVGMLQNMSDPSAIGPQMAVAVLPLFYGVALSELILVPMHSRAVAGVATGSRPEVSKTGLGMAVVMILLSVLLMFALFQSMSSIDADKLRIAIGSMRATLGQPPL